MAIEQHVVDDRVFLLGLDQLYREAMKRHERDDLLVCARRVAAALHVRPVDRPLEGYYGEDDRLKEYFLTMRGLQELSRHRAVECQALPEFRRLLDIVGSPLYGRPEYNGKLLPMGRDALAQALGDSAPQWTLSRLVEAACDAALRTDDFSLVGLAARARDAVALAALRESVVLYAELRLGALEDPPAPRFLWAVDEGLVVQARQFIDAYNTLFGMELPLPEPQQAEQFWHACVANDVHGRCVHIGMERRVTPALHYHWAICRGANGAHEVREFWSPDTWTSDRYRAALRGRERRPDLRPAIS